MLDREHLLIVQVFNLKAGEHSLLKPLYLKPLVFDSKLSPPTEMLEQLLQ